MKGNARSSGYDRVEADFYTEAPWAVDALLKAEVIEGVAFDPAVGSGNIPARCKAAGHFCRGSDLHDRGAGFPTHDFLADDPWMGIGVRTIITNPPFALAEAFADRALSLPHISKIIIFQRLAWLEGKVRGPWFQRTGLTRVWVHSSRVSLAPNGEDIPKTGGSTAYAWFIWCRGHVGAWQGGFLP